MLAEQVMTDDFGQVSDSASLREAANLLAEGGTDVLAVRRGEEIVGLVGFRELAIEGYAMGRDPELTPVSSIMTHPSLSCAPDADLTPLVARMTDQGLEAVAVRSASGNVIGLVTRRRALEALAFPDEEPRGPMPDHVKRVRGDNL
jgi:CBS domain-containing protein